MNEYEMTYVVKKGIYEQIRACFINAKDLKSARNKLARRNQVEKKNITIVKARAIGC